jgi:hypothetical protein
MFKNGFPLSTIFDFIIDQAKYRKNLLICISSKINSKNPVKFSKSCRRSKTGLQLENKKPDLDRKMKNQLEIVSNF